MYVLPHLKLPLGLKSPVPTFVQKGKQMKNTNSQLCLNATIFPDYSVILVDNLVSINRNVYSKLDQVVSEIVRRREGEGGTHPPLPPPRR